MLFLKRKCLHLTSFYVARACLKQKIFVIKYKGYDYSTMIRLIWVKARKIKFTSMKRDKPKGMNEYILVINTKDIRFLIQISQFYAQMFLINWDIFQILG